MSRGLDRRGLGRRLTAATDASVAAVLGTRGVEPILRTRGTHRIGITGPPGAGKSTLIGALADHRLVDGRRIGVVAIDPTSPRTGGSILGDRVRMDAASDHDHFYLRSVPSRQASDGLTDNLPDLVAALEVEPFDEIWVETVGVGQAAYAVRRCVDTVVVLVNPESGDTVQAMKAGILEVGDIYVVTKADRPGADRTAAELEATLTLAAVTAWAPPVLLTAAPTGEGITDLSSAIDRHRQLLEDSGAVGGQNPAQARYDVERLLHRRIRELVGEIDLAAGRTSLAATCSDVARRLAEEMAEIEAQSPTE